MARLNGSDSEKLRQILLRVFTFKQFGMLLSDALNRDLESLSLGDNKEQVIFDVIGEANRGFWTDELVEAARKVRSREASLYAFAQEHFGLGIRTSEVSDAALERLVVKTSSFLNIMQWREKLAAVERQVARISYDIAGGTLYGTGFLIGPSALLTNHHVIKALEAGKAQPATVRVQFDYKKLPDGKVDDGRIVKLATDWLIDSSPYAEADFEVDPVTLPSTEELDYAVLRLAEKVAEEPVVRNSSDTNAPTRGSIDLGLSPDASPGAGTSVFIVQHPKGQPLALAMETQGMLKANGNGTRLRYQTNTEGGSSGSPVFDQEWKLIALHHAGDPDFSELHHPDYNQGVPIHLIVNLLKKRHKYGTLSA